MTKQERIETIKKSIEEKKSASEFWRDFYKTNDVGQVLLDDMIKTMAEEMSESDDKHLAGNACDWLLEHIGEMSWLKTHISPMRAPRHCESEFVATRLSDGRWVGRDRYYGGGKHFHGEEVPFLETCIFLTRTVKLVEMEFFRPCLKGS